MVLLVSQVTAAWMASTVSCTSAGRAVLPMTKQAVALEEIAGADRAVLKRARALIRIVACIFVYAFNFFQRWIDI